MLFIQALRTTFIGLFHQTIDESQKSYKYTSVTPKRPAKNIFQNAGSIPKPAIEPASAATQPATKQPVSFLIRCLPNKGFW